ncbi:class I SAM-dependent methyltransferase [Pseudomonas sp. DTU_2021_1001937_2_SI_NGA_ILE_001]|uniref:class I SAM-dependent methyltransferase n=1 Tax=Pseudomonas sp. DTU_2021_1001937_2_SI_NGA_ILE_001 TaxID=3077589 RepID=UPI0025CBA0BA|nr:class I SAM-dependent methyltransferase [Pseudomonas sp. DTU_2021_1001937_2_SI_NGA_ILE_001]WNW10733.1 class I SAM-dependent methyltransferase [Pseudomonas sp. DTU_2021_1001937_2_SI_NGA_ILE_001]
MSQTQHRPLRISPITAYIGRKNPRILLGGAHQPTLLRYLDGWPRKGGKASAFLLQFVDTAQPLSGYANDQFDLAVIHAPDADNAAVVIHDLTRIARQGLITLG